MKKLALALVALFVVTIQASAMSYEQARQQALFLTDKMAYELNLTDDQYEAAYEINLDYLMSIDTRDDLYGVYWTQRNLDLSYILLDWQYRSYVAASYFYRPLYWDAGYWHFGIYARYPYRDYFYFGRPTFYVSYRGGHSWRVNGGRSWYHGRSYGVAYNGGHQHFGMRDSYNRGDFGRGYRIDSNGRTFGNGNRNIGNDSRNYNNGNRSFGNRQTTTRSYGGTTNGTRSFGNAQGPTRTFSRDQNGQTRTFGNRQSSTRSTATQPNTGRSFGSSSNSNSSPRNTFSPGTGSRSFGSRSSQSSSRSTYPSTRSFGSSSGSSSSRSFGSSSSRSYGNSSGSSSSRSFGSSSGSAPSRSFGGGNSNSSSRQSSGSTGGHFGRSR